MTREELKSLTADLFKSAEEATPIVGDGDKKEWMARRIDEILDNDEPVVNCLLGMDTTSEVVEFMEEQYNERKDETTGNDLPCATESHSDNMTSQTRDLHSVETNKDRVIAGTSNVEDPGIIVEEEIIIIEDISPEMSCSIKDHSNL